MKLNHRKEVKGMGRQQNRREQQQYKLVLATAVIGLATAIINLLTALIAWLNR